MILTFNPLDIIFSALLLIKELIYEEYKKEGKLNLFISRLQSGKFLNFLVEKN